MKGANIDPSGHLANTKKLLRFGTADPRCADCGVPDFSRLCRLRSLVKKAPVILCRKCLARRRPLSAKSVSQKRKRFEADGYPDPRCVICGDPSLNGMERDHLAGAANSDLVEPLCANHHAIKSHEAENGPMAPLRRRNPHRSALVRQAAFDYGLAAILGMMAIADQSQNATRAVFLGIVALALIGWASWDLIADAHFTKVLGPDYDAAIAAEAPR